MDSDVPADGVRDPAGNRVPVSTDFAGPPRLAPLLAQLAISWDLLMARVDGLTDAEYLFAPAPGASSVAPDEHGRGRPTPADRDAVSTRSIGWLVGHLAEMALLRADYTTGTHRMRPDDVAWPLRAAEGLALMRTGWDSWRAAIGSLSTAEAETVGRSDFPWGLDPQLPIIDIVGWMNRELIHHGAEIALVRDLYAARAG